MFDFQILGLNLDQGKLRLSLIQVGFSSKIWTNTIFVVFIGHDTDDFKELKSLMINITLQKTTHT